MSASRRHGRRLTAMLAIVALATLLPVAAMAADPSTSQRQAEQALMTRRERMDAIVAKMRGHDRGTASGAAKAGMAALDADDLAFLGLRAGHGDCAGMFESAAGAPGALCTHGLDLSVPADLADVAGACPFDASCPAPPGWSRTTPPTRIPCYTTGPFVQVMYVYWGTGDLANAKERIHRSIASVDQLFKISAAVVKNGSGTAGDRHVRWAMDSSCKLKITAVKMPTTVSDDIYAIKSNLVGRGLLTSSSKYLAYVDNDYCAGGIAEVAVDSSKGSTNPSNKGGSLAMVYDCWDAFDPYAGFGATLGAHELMHTLGAVQYNAPHTTKGHCWDDLAAAHEGADIMCYNDFGVSASKFYQRCTPTYPETFDCGKDDYFNPYPASGTYLANYWNPAGNKYLSTAEPTAWDTVPKPTVTFTKPSASGGAIGGSTAATITAGVPGIPVDAVDWTVNGAAVDSSASAATTLGMGTARTKSGGYANGTVLTIGAKVTDIGGLTASASTKATVWNPYIRLNTPAAFSYASGTASWSATASATGGRTVAKVELLVEGAVKATDTTAPYGGTFTIPSGLYVNVAARVTDSAGVTRQTPSRQVFQPVVDIHYSAPFTGGAGWDQSYPLRVPAGKTVPLGVVASSPIAGGIDHVDFKVGGSKIATDTTAPYTYDLKLSSTIGALVEVTATGVDAGGNQTSTESLWIKSVASFGSQTATITPNPVDSSQDVAFRLVTTPPSGGVIDTACLYVDNDYSGVGCIYPSYPGNPDTLTVPASTFGAGSHATSWHLSGNTKADYTGDYWELDSGYGHFTVTGAASTPTVTVSGVTAGAKAKGKVTLTATVTGIADAADVQSVSFFEGGRDLGTDYDAPYTATWNTAVGPDGPRTITAVATLRDYRLVRSAGIDVSAVNTSVSLTSPVSGATVSGSVTLAGTGVSDTDCVLESAAFLVDGVVRTTDRVAPFGYAWDSKTVSNGSHTVAVRVQLNDGRTLTTPAITVTVAN